VQKKKILLSEYRIIIGLLFTVLRDGELRGPRSKTRLRTCAWSEEDSVKVGNKGEMRSRGSEKVAN
jgi:hypothetical protein